MDERADVYALGAIAYSVLAGRAPYEGDSSAEVLKQVVLGPPEPLRRLEPGVPVDLAAIVEKAMAREPAARYPSARELAGDLRRYQAGRYVLAREYAFWEPPLRWLRRHFIIATLTAIFLVVGAVGGVIALTREQHLRHVAELERRRAEAQTLSLLEQQARRELDVGRPRRAAVYLAEALRREPGSRVLRDLLSQAMRPGRAHERTLLGHERDVITTAFSPDGAWLATGSADSTVRMWPVQGGGAGSARVLRGHESTLEAVTWSRDGSLLASGDNKSVRVWRVPDGAPLHRFDGGVKSLTFSPDGRQLWGGRHDGSLRVIEVATGQALLAAQPHGDRIHRIVFDRAGLRAFTISWDGRVIVWDAATLRELARIDDQRAPMRFVSFSADGRLALTGDEDGTIHVRDAATFAILHSLHLPTASHANQGWFSADGRTILTASADGSLRVWHATSGLVLETIDTVAEGKLFDADLSPDGELVAMASLRAVDLWRPSAGGDFRVFAGGQHTLASYHPGVLSGDGKTFAATRIPADGAAWIQVWDAASGELRAQWQEDGQPFSLALGRDGARLVVGDLNSPGVLLRDTATGARLGQLTGHARPVYNLALGPDEQRIATAGNDRSVRQWRGEDGAALGPVIELDQRPTAVAFDPARPRLFVALEDGTIAIHDRDSGARLDAFVGHATWIQDLELSSDGARLVSAGRQDHTGKIWDLRGDAPPVLLAGHLDNLMRATFSPDGTMVATAAVDDTARLWDVATGELVRTITGPTHTVAFSPDGRELYTTGTRDYVVAWRLDVDPRDAEVLAAAVEADSPWRLDGGRLLLREPIAP